MTETRMLLGVCSCRVCTSWRNICVWENCGWLEGSNWTRVQNANALANHNVDHL